MSFHINSKSFTLCGVFYKKLSEYCTVLYFISTLLSELLSTRGQQSVNLNLFNEEECTGSGHSSHPAASKDRSTAIKYSEWRIKTQMENKLSTLT